MSHFAWQTAAWLRAEAHWESVSYMRSVLCLHVDYLLLMFLGVFAKLRLNLHTKLLIHVSFIIFSLSY